MLAALRNPKVLLIVSRYGRISRNADALIALLNELKIPCIVYSPDSWKDCADIFHRGRSEDELEKIFGNCCVNDTLTLLHGKLYSCPFSPTPTTWAWSSLRKET